MTWQAATLLHSRKHARLLLRSIPHSILGARGHRLLLHDWAGHHGGCVHGLLAEEAVLAGWGGLRPWRGGWVHGGPMSRRRHGWRGRGRLLHEASPWLHAAALLRRRELVEEPWRRRGRSHTR